MQYIKPGSASLLQELPQFQHDNFTYSGARLIHWLVLQGDVAGLRERQEELGQARDLTCTRQWNGCTCTNVSVLPPVPLPASPPGDPAPSGMLGGPGVPGQAADRGRG